MNNDFYGNGKTTCRLGETSDPICVCHEAEGMEEVMKKIMKETRK